METEYIEKQEAIKAICDSCGVMPDGEKDTCPYKYEGAGCREYDKIIDIPPADVRPVVRGRWVWRHRHRGGFRRVSGEDDFGVRHTITVDERYEIDDPYCPYCGKLNESVFLNYCPSCGADMREAGNGKET